MNYINSHDKQFLIMQKELPNCDERTFNIGFSLLKLDCLEEAASFYNELFGNDISKVRILFTGYYKGCDGDWCSYDDSYEGGNGNNIGSSLLKLDCLEEAASFYNELFGNDISKVRILFTGYYKGCDGDWHSYDENYEGDNGKNGGDGGDGGCCGCCSCCCGCCCCCCALHGLNVCAREGYVASCCELIAGCICSC